MEKPILFNTEEIKAILEGRKTSTRRMVKDSIPQKAEFGYTAFTPKGSISCRGHFNGKYGEKFYKLPYKIGDVIYIRETFANTWTPCDEEGFVYKADGEPAIFPYWGNANQCKDEVWIPSIHMPKKAARLFLKVTDIKVQRLQDITEEEAKAEGITSYTKDEKVYKYAVSDDWWIYYCNKHKRPGTWWQRMPKTATEAFKYLWNSYYKWPKCWEYNPYVFVISFQRLDNYKLK